MTLNTGQCPSASPQSDGNEEAEPVFEILLYRLPQQIKLSPKGPIADSESLSSQEMADVKQLSLAVCLNQIIRIACVWVLGGDRRASTPVGFQY
jgi:hypothetical protein